MEQLDLASIAWGHLDHAYGSALDTPRHLQALASGAVQTRKEALAALRATIHHQYETYSASAAAVPFLVQMALDRAFAERLAVLELLAGLAVGEPDPVRGFDARTRAGKAALACRDGGKATHEAVAGALAKLVTLLRDPDSSVRMAVGLVLSEFPEHGKLIAAELREALATEADHYVIASHLLALRLVVDGDTSDVEDLDRRIAAGNGGDIDVVAACIARLTVGGRNHPALEKLKKAKGRKHPAGFLWGDLRKIGAHVLDLLNLDAPLESLLDELESSNASPGRREQIARLLLPRLCIKGRRGSFMLHSELGAEQRRLLTAIARFGVLNTTEYDVFFRLRRIPPRCELPSWLGVLPNELLDRVADHDGEAWPLWKWVDAAVHDEVTAANAVSAISSVLNPAERLRLVYARRVRDTSQTWTREEQQLTYRYDFRRYYETDGPDDDHAIDRNQDAIDSLAAAILVTCPSQELEAALAQVVYPGVCLRALVAAIGARANREGRTFPTELLPLWTHQRPALFLQEAFVTLPLDVRDTYLEDWRFQSHLEVVRTASGPQRRVVFDSGWILAPWCPTENMARRYVTYIAASKEDSPGLEELQSHAVQLGAVLIPAIREALAKRRKGVVADRLTRLLGRVTSSNGL